MSTTITTPRRDALLAVMVLLTAPQPGCGDCETRGMDLNCAWGNPDFKWEILPIAREVMFRAIDADLTPSDWIASHMEEAERIARDYAYRRDNWDGEEVWIAVDDYTEEDDE